MEIIAYQELRNEPPLGINVLYAYFKPNTSLGYWYTVHRSSLFSLILSSLLYYKRESLNLVLNVLRADCTDRDK